jgi:hypothetical protein
MAVMAPRPGSDADYIRDKARRDLLNLLEGVSKAADLVPVINRPLSILTALQVRGKKNLVISKDLAGPSACLSSSPFFRNMA